MILLRISDDALADLNDGYWFYELQDTGLGEYFASTLRSDIEGLKVTAGIHHRDYPDYHRVLSRVFHMPFITPSQGTKWLYGPLSTADVIQRGLGATWINDFQQ